MACRQVKMRRWHAFGTPTRWPVNHTSTQARWHVNHAGTQTRWYVDYVGMQAHMARDLANSSTLNFIDVYLLLELFFVQL